MKIILSNSNLKGKKFKAVVYGGDGKKLKTFHFGARGYEDYTMHHDNERKQRYIDRHKNEDHTKINPGSLSRYILWNKISLSESIKDFEKRFGVKIIWN